MLPVVFNTDDAEVLAVTAVADDFAMALTATKLYRFVCDVPCYIAQGDTPTAVAAAGTGSAFVPASTECLIAGRSGAVLSVVRSGGADGLATLVPCVVA
jgi:hypothetical protein